MLILIHAFDMPFSNVQEYYNSFALKKDFNSYAISLVNKGAEQYFKWIYAYEKNMYYLVDDSNPNYIIGFGVIKYSKSLDYHSDWLNTGAIGYGIRPNERNKSYGTKLLNLLLQKCRDFGINEVCISCLKENPGSQGVILNNDGVLEKEFFDNESGKQALKYWINLETLDKNLGHKSFK